MFVRLLSKAIAGVRESGRVEATVAFGAVAVVGVVIMCVAAYLLGDGISAVPIVRMAAVPVVSKVPVVGGPVAAETDEDVLAVMEGVTETKGQAVAAAVRDDKAKPRPDYSVAQPGVTVFVNVLVAMAAF